MAPFKAPAVTGITITNPLVIYRTLLATKTIEPDPAQHRLALHLQKLYYRLKDYTPQAEYRDKLDAIRKTFGKSPLQQEDSPIALRSHPLRRNPLLAHLFLPKAEREQNALTRSLTSQEAALQVNSPKGLLLYGEVGTGKSMLVDLLADSLPNPKKQRWHFNTFMLETIAHLERLRQQRVANGENGSEYSLLLLAKDLIEKSPILFLDEFQLPDRAASKILSNLFTIFFQLGGVLIATSNRMPEELSKASGIEFTPPPKSYIGKWFNVTSLQTPVFAGNSEFAGFLELLKARCEIWDMEGDRDWRRRDILLASDKTAISEVSDLATKVTVEELQEDNSLEQTAADLPAFYAVQETGTDISNDWEARINQALVSSGVSEEDIQWTPTTLSVYGRTIQVPRQCMGITRWTFKELCEGFFGPADYITIASTFHTLILEDVPVLTVLQKNEARRMITLLDALYEARCKLIIRAQAGPDDLFFPEVVSSKTSDDELTTSNHDNEDATYAETIAEIYQDQTVPFRPNVSLYKEGEQAEFDMTDDGTQLANKRQEAENKLNFGMTSAFTGEDERFAYKRARSRLWEMCGSRWHARSEPGWWRPLSSDVRQWERSTLTLSSQQQRNSHLKGDVQMGPSVELDEPAGLRGIFLQELAQRRTAQEQATSQEDSLKKKA